jgi:hypothetical protein
MSHDIMAASVTISSAVKIRKLTGVLSLHLIRRRRLFEPRWTFSAPVVGVRVLLTDTRPSVPIHATP